MTLSKYLYSKYCNVSPLDELKNRSRFILRSIHYLKCLHVSKTIYELFLNVYNFYELKIQIKLLINLP